jgi:hypothetical protein
MATASTKIHIDAEEQGGAPSLIFLHYGGGASRTWCDVIGALPGAHRSPWTFAAGARRTLPAKVMRWRTLRTTCATSSPSAACRTSCWAGTRWAARSPNSSRRKIPKGWSGWCSLLLRLQRRSRCHQSKDRMAALHKSGRYFGGSERDYRADPGDCGANWIGSTAYRRLRPNCSPAFPMRSCACSAEPDICRHLNPRVT